MNPRAHSLSGHAGHMAGIAALLLLAGGLAAAEEQPAAEIERALLELAPVVGPPPETDAQGLPPGIRSVLAAGNPEFSLAFALRIGDAASRANALVALLGSPGPKPDRDHARALLAQVDGAARDLPPDARAQVLAASATFAAKLGDPGPARDLVARSAILSEGIAPGPQQARVLAQLAEAAAALNDAASAGALQQQALQAVAQIADSAMRARVLARLALSTAHGGDSAQGGALLARATRFANSMPDELARAAVLGAIAEAAAQLGDARAARTVLENLIDAARNMESGLGQARTLASVAAAAAQLPDPAEGRAVLARVLDASAGIEAEFTKARWLLIALAGAEVKLGNAGQARTLAENALRASQGPGSDLARIRYLESVAAAAAILAAADPAGARMLLDGVVLEADKVASAALKMRVLANVARAAGKLGAPAQARALWESVRAAAARGHGEAERVGVLLALAETAGETGQARSLLGEALQETLAIAATAARSHALIALGEAALRLGERAPALQALQALHLPDVKGIASADVARAVALAASLGAWRLTLAAARTADSSLQLDALSRAFAALPARQAVREER